MALNKDVLVEMPAHCVRAKKDKAVYIRLHYSAATFFCVTTRMVSSVATISAKEIGRTISALGTKPAMIYPTKLTAAATMA